MMAKRKPKWKLLYIHTYTLHTITLSSAMHIHKQTKNGARDFFKLAEILPPRLAPTLLLIIKCLRLRHSFPRTCTNLNSPVQLTVAMSSLVRCGKCELWCAGKSNHPSLYAKQSNALYWNERRTNCFHLNKCINPDTTHILLIKTISHTPGPLQSIFLYVLV